MRRALAILIAVAAAAIFAGCGASTPDHTPVTPASDFSDPSAGVAFRAPKAATVQAGKGQQVVVLRRGESTLTVSRFPREEKLPDSAREFERAARILTAEYARHAPSSSAGVSQIDYQSDTAQIAGKDAVVVTATGNGSTAEHIHLYEHGAEIVIDMVAPTADVRRTRFILFDPVLTSLKITRPKA